LEPHLQRIDDLRSDLNFHLRQNLQKKQLQLLALKKQMLALRPSHQIHGLKQKLVMFAKSIHASMIQQLSTRKKSCDKLLLRKNLDQRVSEQIHRKTQKLMQLGSHLRGIDPKNLLTRGYCILFHEKKDSVILSIQELKEQDKVRLQLHDGHAHLTVNGTKA
jgi:exodeoxyribonuclease VII large subunit